MPTAVVPKSMSVAGSGVGLGTEKAGTETAKPSAKAKTCKKCDPGPRSNKKASEPESELKQLLLTGEEQRSPKL
jgi:hypothetical protein